MTRAVTVEDLYRIKAVSRPRIAPDGKRVAYVVKEINEYTHATRSAIWMVSTEKGTPQRFTGGLANANNPVWSPDGRWLAFVSNRESEDIGNPKEQTKKGKGKPQIWLLPTTGGEARQLTFMEHGATSPVWSPDSKYVAFVAEVGPSEETEGANEKPLPKVRVIDRLWYRLDGVGFIYERRHHLFVIEIASGKLQQLTDGDWEDSNPVWSPDGTSIAFTSNRTEERWRVLGDDIYILPWQDGKPGEPRRLTDTTLGCTSPSWSPDGKTLAFIGAPKRNAAGHYLLYTISVEENDAVARCLTQGFEGSCADWTNSDVGDEHLAPPPGWSPDGKTIYFLASQRGATRIYAIGREGQNQPFALTSGDIHVRDYSLDSAVQTFAMLVGDPTHPQEIYVSAVEQASEMRCLSYANDEWCREVALSVPEQLLFTGADGWEIEGWVMKPADFDPTRKYPLVVEIHGGPHTQYGYGFFLEMQLLVAQGYVVFYTNPRGSIGYGYEFAHTLRGVWGEKDSVDIMMGVDALIKQGYIDEQKLAVTGGSYGGFMTNWLLGHYPERFKVAITDRCVSNMATMFGTSDFGWDFADDNLETTPWENLDKYMRMSPITYVQNIRTPLLIIHSDQDLRCNLEQAEQLFTALKWMGREVQLVIFEGQSHGLSRDGHPKSRWERLQHIVNWFAKYLS